MVDLSDKRAIVGGGSQGIGRACAIELARRGASVTVVARNEKALRAVVSELGEGDHQFLVADFAEPDALRDSVASHLAEFGPVTILVNNTGGPPAGPIVDATPEQFQAAISNHLLCNQLLVQTLLPGMKSEGFGRIVNIISTSVIAPIKGLGVSNATRGAVANWGRTLAGELAPFGITVNNVLPGFTGTDRLQILFDNKAKRLGVTPEQVKQDAIDTIPTGRLGEPEEIAAAVGFFASPQASYITGVNLPVDGGRTAVQ
jgi:3-oxoacyl-[acyl-carrier protein] reductase